MTSPQLWWKERLQAHFPLSDLFKQTPYNYKPKEGVDLDTVWPGRVARQALFLDYSVWADRINAEAYPAMEKADRPPIATQLLFYSTLAPFLYINDKVRMVKSYWVTEQTMFEGRWIDVKKRRYFIRLEPWQAHVDAYTRQTGNSPL